VAVAVKDVIPCNGERELFIALDFNTIEGEQIRPVKRGLRALRPAGVLVIGKPSPDGQYSPRGLRLPTPPIGPLRISS